MTENIKFIMTVLIEQQIINISSFL